MKHVMDDVSIWNNNYKVMTREQLKIPGLHMIGHAHFQEAYDRLDTHFHTNLEFVVVVKGRQHYTVGDEKFLLYGNEMFVTYPYEQHGNGDSAQEICEFIWFQIDLSVTENFLGLASGRSEYLHQQFSNYKSRTKKVTISDVSRLQKAFYLLASEEQARQNLGYSIFLEFVMKYICELEHKNKKDEYSEDIEKAISYIHENLFQELGINKIAENCGLSASRFKAKFTEQVGVTPHSYIMELKIDSAKIYLKDAGFSITDIAYLMNFSSSNHFAAVFKKYTGCTPTEFRSQKFPDMY